MIDEQKALDHIEFLQLLKLTGDFHGQPLVLLPWQTEIIHDVYGTVNADGTRQYKYAYLEVAKKNGKTELIASLAVDHVLNDPPSGQIYCCAAEREQASLVYLAAKEKVEQDAYLDSVLDIVDSKKEIHNRITGTFIKVLSAEAYSKHGINPTVIIFDELHALQKRDLWDTMTFGSGSARKEQLIWVITTAGDDPDRKSIGWEQHEYARKVRDGEIIDPTWYVKIYSAPENVNIFDETVWKEANPSLGVTISLEAVRKEALLARNSPSAERLFRWLRLNQWIALKRVGWLPITLWDKTDGTWSRADMLGRECYVGIDLSSTTDLTAIAVLFPPKDNEPWRFFIEAWIPEDNMRERENRDHVPFERWVREKYVHATPGNCVDYAYIANSLDKLMLDYKVKFFCADEWRLSSLAPLMKQDIAASKIITIPQTMAGMSPGMSELEHLFLKGQIEHEKNPCGRWTFGNVVPAMDGNENKKPMKNRSIDRIDPICALINAMAAALKMEPKRSIYESRGLRVVG